MNDNKFYIEVGAKIRNFREKRGLTQSQLGDKLGVTKNAVYCWETGKSSLHLETAKQICAILDIQLTDLTN